MAMVGGVLHFSPCAKRGTPFYADVRNRFYQHNRPRTWSRTVACTVRYRVLCEVCRRIEHDDGQVWYGDAY